MHPVCKYTVHERCVQRCMASCITTYSKKKTKGTPTFQHHWTEGNCYGRCSKCRKRIKAYHGITGLTCRWCRMTVSISVISHFDLYLFVGVVFVIVFHLGKQKKDTHSCYYLKMQSVEIELGQK